MFNNLLELPTVRIVDGGHDIAAPISRLTLH